MNDNPKKKFRISTALIAVGLIMILASIGWIAHNRLEDSSAGKASKDMTEQIWAQIRENLASKVVFDDVPDYVRNPNMEMRVVDIDGWGCVGMLEIPTQNLELPVVGTYSMEAISYAPARYSGSPYLKNMVVCAHNFDSHFGRLRLLEQGDPIKFTDMDGNEFNYTVGLVEILDPWEVDKMIAGEWDLSLFTCTFDSRSRVTVRAMEEGTDVEIVDVG